MSSHGGSRSEAISAFRQAGNNNTVLSDASKRVCICIIFVVQIVHSVFLVEQLAACDKPGGEGADPAHSEGIVFDEGSRHCYGGILDLFEIGVKQEHECELQ